MPQRYLLWHSVYAVRLRDDKVVLSDLRMGVECGYVFNFVVGVKNGEDITAGPFSKFTERPDISGIHLVWERIWNPEIVLAPDKTKAPWCRFDHSPE